MISIPLLLGALNVAKEQPGSNDTLTTAIIVILCAALVIALLFFGYFANKAGSFIGSQFKLVSEQLEKSNESFQTFRDEQKDTNDTMKAFMKDSKRVNQELQDKVFKQDAKLNEHEKELKKHAKIICKHHPDADLD